MASPASAEIEQKLIDAILPLLPRADIARAALAQAASQPTACGGLGLVRKGGQFAAKPRASRTSVLCATIDHKVCESQLK